MKINQKPWEIWESVQRHASPAAPDPRVRACKFIFLSYAPCLFNFIFPTSILLLKDACEASKM